MTLAYLVHDLGDAAVARRVTMFSAGGAVVRLAGFRRGLAPEGVAGVRPVDLGQTGDGRLLQRAMAVLRVLLARGQLRALVAGADAIVARNLETLVLAAAVRGEGQRLVYECLDIHRSLLGQGLAARAIQWVEQRLLSRVDLILTSSNRFADDYFASRRGVRCPVLLVENKVLALAGGVPAAVRMPAGPPWVIGWFGMLRCRRSLAILTALVAQSGGRVEVLLAGVPAERELGDLAAHVAATPGMRFLGRYAAADLPRLYGQVHFAWAIDHFEEGLNSAWLLPNRLYGALAHGAVPMALAGVETGAWLARHGVGLVLEDDDAAVVTAVLDDYDADALAAARAAVAAVPRALLETGVAECEALVDMIRSGVRRS